MACVGVAGTWALSTRHVGDAPHAGASDWRFSQTLLRPVFVSCEVVIVSGKGLVLPCVNLPGNLAQDGDSAASAPKAVPVWEAHGGPVAGVSHVAF